MPPYLMHPHSQALLAVYANSGTQLAACAKSTHPVHLVLSSQNARCVYITALLVDKVETADPAGSEELP